MDGLIGRSMTQHFFLCCVFVRGMGFLYLFELYIYNSHCATIVV